MVLHDEERHSFSLGGADTNHYLYYVWAKETELGIICNHGIADARRLVQFATTLLYYYAARLGLPGTDVALPGVIREGDLTFPSYDPSVSEARTPTGPQRRPDFSTLFSLPVSYGEDVGDFRSYVDVISCKATDLRELAHRVCSRISPLVMALQAQGHTRRLGHVRQDPVRPHHL